MKMDGPRPRARRPPWHLGVHAREDAREHPWPRRCRSRTRVPPIASRIRARSSSCRVGRALSRTDVRPQVLHQLRARHQALAVRGAAEVDCARPSIRVSSRSKNAACHVLPDHLRRQFGPRQRAVLALDGLRLRGSRARVGPTRPPGSPGADDGPRSPSARSSSSTFSWASHDSSRAQVVSVDEVGQRLLHPLRFRPRRAPGSGSYRGAPAARGSRPSCPTSMSITGAEDANPSRDGRYSQGRDDPRRATPVTASHVHRCSRITTFTRARLRTPPRASRAPRQREKIRRVRVDLVRPFDAGAHVRAAPM